MRRWLAYKLFDVAGRLLPPAEKQRVLRIIRLGGAALEDEERVPVEQVVLR
jgi:hypothetical protein